MCIYIYICMFMYVYTYIYKFFFEKKVYIIKQLLFSLILYQFSKSDALAVTSCGGQINHNV